MADLNILNLVPVNAQFPYSFQRLGTKVPLELSSPANIYTSVRRVLRIIYYPQNVTVIVSCTATLQNGMWVGRCLIGGVSYTWEVQ